MLPNLLPSTVFTVAILLLNIFLKKISEFILFGFIKNIFVLTNYLKWQFNQLSISVDVPIVMFTKNLTRRLKLLNKSQHFCVVFIVLSSCLTVSLHPLFNWLIFPYCSMTVPFCKTLKVVSELHRAIKEATKKYVYFSPVPWMFSVVNANQFSRFQICFLLEWRAEHSRTFLLSFHSRVIEGIHGLSLFQNGIPGQTMSLILLMFLDLTETRISMLVMTCCALNQVSFNLGSSFNRY